MRIVFLNLETKFPSLRPKFPYLDFLKKNKNKPKCSTSIITKLISIEIIEFYSNTI